MQKIDVAIIGAGPIGLEAALYASQLGYKVRVFEKGEVGEHFKQWGHVTLFSPWKMNHTSLGTYKIKQHFPHWKFPDPEDYLTGREHREIYLQPLSRLPELHSIIQTGVRVEFIGREGLLKGDYIGQAERAQHPFRLLTVDVNGHEKIYHAEVVIDTSGVYSHHNWLGDGGVPAIGERSCAEKIAYELQDIYGKDRKKYAGKTTLLIGSGYSAATAISDFRNLIQEEPATEVIWVVRTPRSTPIPRIENDPLPNRAKLTDEANQLAKNSIPQIKFRNKTTVESIQYLQEKDKFQVQLKTNGKLEPVEVDHVIAHIGYSPDHLMYRELQVHECFATCGPMNLAAALLGSSSTDCLAQTSHGPKTLKNPEPNFYILGNKSYGRNSNFLLRIGFSQIQEIFTLITGDEGLNLYQKFSKAIKEYD